MNTDSILTKSEDLMTEELHGEVLLLNTLTLDAHHLSTSAKQIWDLLDGQQSLASIIESLSEAYPEHKDSIKTDVIEAAQTLVDNQLAEFVTP